MLVSPAQPHIQKHIHAYTHAMCIQSHYFPFTFTLKIVVMANCARNISLFSYTILASYWKILVFHKRERRRKKQYKILSERRDNYFFYKIQMHAGEQNICSICCNIIYIHHHFCKLYVCSARNFCSQKANTFETVLLFLILSEHTKSMQ